MEKIGFIGAGNMAGAIARGIAGSALSGMVSLFAADLDAEKVRALADAGVTSLADASVVVRECRYVVLAVKPQVIEAVLDGIAPEVREDTVLISIAAGITAEFIRAHTRADAKVVPVMPNTPLLLGCGATAMAKLPGISGEEFAFVQGMFAASGTVAVVPAEKMREVIALNGSSPAFVYLYAKHFIEYGMAQGFAEEVARELFCQSLVGSAEMLRRSGHTVDELIRMVSSPGGTTLAGLAALEEGGLSSAVQAACEACTKRAYELSR